MCILLYDDRVNTYHRMQEIDALIDDQTTLAMELVNLDIRNTQAYKELQSYNDTSTFLYIHPITVKTKFKLDERTKLRNLQKDDPMEFLTEITNTKQNLRRIESSVRKQKYKSEEEHQSWLENIEKAKIKLDILIELIK